MHDCEVADDDAGEDRDAPPQLPVREPVDPPQRERTEMLRPFLALAARLCAKHHRRVWERFGFAVPLALGVGMVSAFGAAVMREDHPTLIGIRWGAWALVLGLGAAFMLVFKSQVLRAFRSS